MSDPEPLVPFPVVASERVYDSRWCGLRRDLVRLADGSVQEHHVFEVGEAVAIVPLLPDGRVLLLWQYRHALGRSHWEIPAGRLHAGEAPEAGAARELSEETGHAAERLERLQGFFPISGISAHHAHLFVAHGCRETGRGTAHEASERMSLHALAPEVVLARLREGAIEDGFALVGLARHFLRATR